MLEEVELTIPSATPKLDNIISLQNMETSLQIQWGMDKDGTLLEHFAVHWLPHKSCQYGTVLPLEVCDPIQHRVQASIWFQFDADSTYMMHLYLLDNTPTNNAQASKAPKLKQHPQTK